MRSKAEIRREIEKVSSEYTAQDLFSSPYFQEMLQATINAVCERLGRMPRLSLICDEKSDLTAATNGPVILVNAQGPLIRNISTNWGMYVSNIGHTVHECGHCLFTDFKNQNRLLGGWITDTEFSFYPKAPKVKGAKETAEIMKRFPNLRKIYGAYMQSVTNALEDAYIENRLRDNFDGLAAAGLALVNEEMYKQAPPLEKGLQKVLDGEIPPVQIAHNIILSRYVDFKEPKAGTLTKEQQELFDAVESILNTARGEIERLCTEQDGRARCELFNSLYVKLLPLMPFPMQQPESGGSGKGEENEEGGDTGEEPNDSGEETSGGMKMRDYSDSEGNAGQRMAEENQKASGQSQNPEGDTSGIKQEGKPYEDGTPGEKIEQAGALAGSEGSMERELQSAIREAARRAVLEADERQHAADLSKEAKLIEGDIKKISSFSGFTGYRLTRPSPDRHTYNSIFPSVRRTSKNLTRKIQNILKERETESVESGFLMGQRFNARDVVTGDGKYFSRQIVPDGKAEVAFGVLIDESGSMCCRDKYITARRAAILLEDALRGLDIPLMVAGHTETSCGDCTLHIYTDFDTYDGLDCYRLSGITAEGGNIDGAAITYMGEKLLRRPEKIKVLIVISDGLPAGTSFYSRDANMDTKLAAEAYRKKGVEVFGAVVDSFEQVSAIYGEAYCFDCREDSALEKQLIKLIKRFVLLKG